MTDNDVKCKVCEFLMFSDCYGECSKAYKGIVSPNDSCGKGMRKGGNMTDNEIIKALERCVQYTTTDVRTYKGMPLDEFSQAVLDLINRQKAEIEKLISRVSVLAEIEKDYALKYGDDIDVSIVKKQIKSEAIKEFAERLKIEAFSPLGTWFSERVVTEAKIDNLVNEMTGDQNDD